MPADMYETLARYYDQIHASLTADIPFVTAQLAKYGGPLLELGCGTGRLLFPLAQAGLAVTGIDNSPQMLAIARQRLHKQPPDVQQMITLLDKDLLNLVENEISTRFASALLSYNTILHFREAEIGRMLRGVAGLALPGCRLLIDTANPFALTESIYPDGPVLETSFIDQQTAERVRQWSESSLDTAGQTLTVLWRFQRGGDEALETQLVQIDYHYLYPHQLILLLQQSGFTLEKMWGSYQEDPFAEDSERLLLLARLQSL
jgi:SAM-dependent methyltransferase